MTRNTQIHTCVNVNTVYFYTWSEPGIYWRLCKFTRVCICVHMRTCTYVCKIYIHVKFTYVCKRAGTVKGARRRGRQKKRWEDNIKEWTGMGFGDSLRAAEDREGWKGIVATSSVVPRRPPRLRDWDEMRWDVKVRMRIALLVIAVCVTRLYRMHNLYWAKVITQLYFILIISLS